MIVKTMKYYDKIILKEIKNLFFKHFMGDKTNELKQYIIDGTFTSDDRYIFNQKDFPGVATSEIVKLMDDYMYIRGDAHQEPYYMVSQKAQELERYVENVEEILRVTIDNHLDETDLEAITILGRNPNSYIVGGFVRDVLNGKEPKDIDFVTSTSYNDLKEQFENEDWKVLETGKQFLVLSISKDGKTYEIANFRKDGTYTDGRRPDSVSIGTIEDDGDRRDFTINAMYLNIYNYNFIDPTGQGLADHIEGIVKFVGSPKERLNEDLLRVYRFYRMLGKGYLPDPKSLSACREAFECAQEKISYGRVRMEIEKMVL